MFAQLACGQSIALAKKNSATPNDEIGAKKEPASVAGNAAEHRVTHVLSCIGDTFYLLELHRPRLVVPGDGDGGGGVTLAKLPNAGLPRGVRPTQSVNIASLKAGRNILTHVHRKDAAAAASVQESHPQSQLLISEFANVAEKAILYWPSLEVRPREENVDKFL